MNSLERIGQKDYLITMNDIILEGHPTLRQKANPVPIPLDSKLINLGQNMLQFLKNSQDEELAKKLKLTPGIGLAAPQLNISQRIIALLIPDENKQATFQEIMYNPRIISYSVQKCALSNGEGCLSVKREVPGFVPRNFRITVTYTDINNEPQKLKLKSYQAIAVQHEIDHLNGILFFDHINNDAPWNIPQGMELI